VNAVSNRDKITDGARRRKDFLRLRKSGEGALDANESEDGAPAPPRRSERARAAAYLDLWERHVGRMAVHGPRLWSAPWPAIWPGAGPRSGAKPRQGARKAPGRSPAGSGA
jgi:hypothetical protein